MPSSAQLTDLALRAAVAAAAAATPFIGRGTNATKMLDEVAGEALAAVIRSSPWRVAVDTAEGERDGVGPLPLPSARSDPDAEFRLCCDAVDGTTAASRGGPRSVSAVGIYPRSMRDWFTRLPDATSIFGIGSHRLDVSGFWRDRREVAVRLLEAVGPDAGRIGMLHRQDNLALPRQFGYLGEDRKVGQTFGYLPTICDTRWLAVGDTSIPLALEVDTVVGRSGLVEARFEATLFRHWGGVVVSRDRIKAHRGGIFGYLDDHDHARQRPTLNAVQALFTASEVESFRRCGLTAEQILGVLDAESFGMGPDSGVALAGVTGTCEDHVRSVHTEIDAVQVRDQELLIDVWTVRCGVVTRQLVAAARGPVPASHTRTAQT